jgi:tetratricopeptide (TPR) repeat protein
MYALARFFLETGSFQRAESVLKGIIEIAPDHSNSKLAMAYLGLVRSRLEDTLRYTRQVLDSSPDSALAMLYLVMASLTAGDLQTAGAYLGEIGDLISEGAVDDGYLERLYRAQMVRYTAMMK